MGAGAQTPNLTACAMPSRFVPHYPSAGRGRGPYPLASMLRVHLMQNWFALSNPAMEEALYEIAIPNFRCRTLWPARRQLMAMAVVRPRSV